MATKKKNKKTTGRKSSQHAKAVKSTSTKKKPKRPARSPKTSSTAEGKKQTSDPPLPSAKITAAKKRAEYRRDWAANQSRADSAASRDIGPIPKVENPARRAKALADFEFFNLHYFPERFSLPFSPDHKTIIRKTERVIWESESFAEAMDRGGGKTTLCETACIFAIFGGWHMFVALVCSDADAAGEVLESVKTELETNDRLLADFPEICFPIRALDGISNRCRGQTHQGKRTAMKWDSSQIIMPTIPDSQASGATIKCRGITGRIRGMQRTLRNGKKIRPTLAIVDDPQTDESAYSASQCDKREKIIKRAVRGLAGPGQKMAIILPCTVIVKNDLADRLLDRERNPEFHGERFKMLYAFPKHMEMWEGRYAELRREGLKNEKGLGAATAYYKRNRKKMSQGSKVAWKERFGSDEIDALQHAMNLFLQDRGAFFSERQNDPEDETDRDTDLLTADQIVVKVNGYARGIVPIDCDCLVAECDVQGQLLYWIVIACARDGFTTAVIDYGTFPDQELTYFTLRTIRRSLSRAFPGAGLEGRIFKGLSALIDGTGNYEGLAGRSYKCEDGSQRRIELIGIDSGYQKKTVFQFVAQCDAPNVIPTRGLYIGARQTPLSERPKKKGQRIGDFWILKPDEEFKTRKLEIDTNFAKTFLHARLAQQDGDIGAMRFYGRIGKRRVSATHHQMMADHYAAETPHKTFGNGRHLVEWTLPTNKPDNHGGDCAAGALAMASALGCRLATDKPRKQTKKKSRRKRVSYF